MKVVLAEDRTIKSREFNAGDEVIVNRETGTRMVDEGIANRVVEVVPENRTRGLPGVQRFSGHKITNQHNHG